MPCRRNPIVAPLIKPYSYDSFETTVAHSRLLDYRVSQDDKLFYLVHEGKQVILMNHKSECLFSFQPHAPDTYREAFKVFLCYPFIVSVSIHPGFSQCARYIQVFNISGTEIQKTKVQIQSCYEESETEAYLPHQCRLYGDQIVLVFTGFLLFV